MSGFLKCICEGDLAVAPASIHSLWDGIFVFKPELGQASGTSPTSLLWAIYTNHTPKSMDIFFSSVPWCNSFKKNYTVSQLLKVWGWRVWILNHSTHAQLGTVILCQEEAAPSCRPQKHTDVALHNIWPMNPTLFRRVRVVFPSLFF